MGLCTHSSVCEKCLVHIEESVLLQVVCIGPYSPVCSTRELQQESFIQFFSLVW